MFRYRTVSGAQRTARVFYKKTLDQGTVEADASHQTEANEQLTKLIKSFGTIKIDSRRMSNTQMIMEEHL